MAPKRVRSNSNHDDALVYFIGTATEWQPTNARLGSFHELILDAHQWGEMRVRAEMCAMQLREVPARTRMNILTTSSEKWYVSGYQLYLLPESSDSLDALRYKPRTNEALMAQTEWSRRALASQAGVTWRAKYATAIFDEALAAVEAEKPPTPAPMATASPVTASATTSRARAPLVRPPPPPPASAALPHTLASFLADPAEKLASNPRAGIEDAVAEAFNEQRVCRAWEGNTLRFLEKPAYTLQSELHARGLDTVYGCGKEELGKDVMRRAGLQRLAAGGYNAVWVVSDRGAPWLRDLFGHEVGDAFLAKKLVLRVPRPHTEWLSFKEAVGEASNMLLTALCGVGPRVAMLSYASKTFPDDEADEEGVRVPKYKIFAFLERATESVDRRYDPNALQVASATASSSYVTALVACVYQFSQEGFVHLDATLRNFVDCYDRELPLQLVDWNVKVIDVDQKSFRRLCPNASTEWRDLFLMNILIVFTFLKLRLGHRWDRQRHWSPVAQGVAQLLREVPGRATLPSIAFWEGCFLVDEPFPDMSGHTYSACSHEASARFMLRQMRFYLISQPLQICEAQYLKARFSTTRADPAAILSACAWYDNVYRPDMYPAHCYFRDALQPRANGKPRLFAAVLYEFLNTPHSELRIKYANKLSLSKDHVCFGGSISREAILGI